MTSFLRTLTVAEKTDIGLHRPKNEDSVGSTIPPPGSLHERYGALFLVADGMGAMGGGDIASRTAVAEIAQTYYASGADDPMDALQKALEVANAAVRRQAQQIDLPRIGSTVAGLILLPTAEAIVFNVGDSRVYRVRRSYIEQLSHDQSVLQYQIDAGVIREEDTLERRNVNVTAFVGQPTPLEAVYKQVTVEEGDIFILCSDGLWDVVQSHEMLGLVLENAPSAAAKKLVKLTYERGAPDNVSVIIVRVGAGPDTRKLWFGVAALTVALGIAGGMLLLSSNGKQEPRVTPTQGPLAAANLTEEMGVGEAGDGTPSPTLTLRPVLSVSTATPRRTATKTPTTVPPTDTAEPTNTATVSPSDTPEPTPTASHTPEPTATPTARATRTNTAAPSPTDTDTPPPTATSTFTATPTRAATATATPRPPSPTAPPASTPALSPEEYMLVLAEDEGVLIQEETPLYIEGAESLVLSRMLAPGTYVKLLHEAEIPNPLDTDEILRYVKVFDRPGEDVRGWVPRTALERALPIIPHVIVKGSVAEGAAVRIGDGPDYAILVVLYPGQAAKLLGVSNEGTGWYNIKLDDGRLGWVAPNVVIVLGDVRQIPRILVTPTVSSTPPAQQ